MKNRLLIAFEHGKNFLNLAIRKFPMNGFPGGCLGAWIPCRDAATARSAATRWARPILCRFSAGYNIFQFFSLIKV